MRKKEFEIEEMNMNIIPREMHICRIKKKKRKMLQNQYSCIILFI